MNDGWETQQTVLGKRSSAKDNKSNRAVNSALRTGASVNIDKKYGAGGNQQKLVTKNVAVLDGETEELKHETVGLDFCKVLKQARATKGWTQKDLSQRINEKPQIVAEYESGKAIPNNQIQTKMERALGIQLRGKNAGQPLAPRGKKK